MGKKILNEKEMVEAKRKKQLAIIKANKELLEYAKETALTTDKITDDIERTKNVMALDMAIKETEMKAKTYLNASIDEIENVEYGEASEYEKEKYKKRLEKRGITEEQLERTETAAVSFGTKEETSTKRKNIPVKRKSKDKKEDNEEIIRLSDEEEIMKSTMATDEKIIENKKKLTKQEDKELKKATEAINDKKVKVDETIKEVANISTDIEENNKKIKKQKVVKYQFDTSSIPENTQYDVIPLPSKGQCYPIDSPLRCGRVPVSYITAYDENIIASPMMYRDNKIIDIILERKILDKNIDIKQLVRGDRDAIILWLRANAYDSPLFPIMATNPNTGKKYDVSINLGDVKFLKFDLEGDENGCFDFKTSNGDLIKYRYLTKENEDNLINTLYEKTNNSELLNLLKYTEYMKKALENANSIDESDKKDINGCISDMEDIIKDNAVDIDNEEVFVETVTEQMIMNTYSVNGNTDRDYIRSYITNMRSNNAFKYRGYINSHIPGVDFKLTIDIPESDGGGSFETFLRFDDTVFINI